MKIPKLEFEKIIKLFTQRFSRKMQKPDIIGYEWVDNSTMTGVKYMRKKTPPEAPEWFKAYEERQNAFNTEVIKRLDVVENNVRAMMNTPTMKKELKKK